MYTRMLMNRSLLRFPVFSELAIFTNKCFSALAPARSADLDSNTSLAAVCCLLP